MAVQIKRVIVIGGGIGGLCTAVGLHRAGQNVTVYERSPVFSVVGAGLTLWANAVKAFRKLGIDDDGLGGTHFQTSEICSANGTVLYHSEMKTLAQKLGAPSIAVHRADLHRVLLSALPAEVVQSKKCVGFEQNTKGVTVFFSDGSVERTDLLVGADGINSAVRKVLFPNVTLRYAGYTAWRGVVSLRGGIQHDRTVESWGRGSRFGIVPIGGKQTYWFATGNVPAGQKMTDSQRKIELLQRFRGWHSPIEALIDATPAEDILHNDIYDFDPLPRWTQGRVTLLGDAAHATTPNLGQGACQAVESSVSLVRSLLEENDLSSALHRYETERKPRTAWITTTSRRLGQVGQLDNRLLCLLRNVAVRLTPTSVMENQLKQAAGYEI
jgi:FAD-dependent urate hydroxylase